MATLTLTDAEGKTYKWTLNTDRTRFTSISLRGKRMFWGYSFADHNGYVRIVEGTSVDLNNEVKFVARNYGFLITDDKDQDAITERSAIEVIRELVDAFDNGTEVTDILDMIDTKARRVLWE